MTRNRNQEQFDDYRAWQWCKHVTLRRYITPWSVIVGKWAPAIIAVDACAGAGSYLDPSTGLEVSEGSPIIFARRAASYTKEHGPGRTMHVIGVEKDRTNFDLLTERVSPFASHVTLHRGGIAHYASTIAERLGNAPALILLDPIGMKTITFADWEPLLVRGGRTDLFITLHFAVVHRIGGMLLPDGNANPETKNAIANARMLDGVFRGPEWRQIAIDPDLQGDELREQREERYVQLYYDQVIGERHRWKCAFPVRARMSAPIKYWLVQASDDLKPYMLMNDQIVELTETLIQRDYLADGVLEGFVEAEIEAHRSRVRGQLEDATLKLLSDAPGRTLPLGTIKEQLIGAFFGIVKDGGYWSVVKALVKDDCLVREKRKAAAADPLEMISLPSRQPDDDQRADVIPIRRVA